MPTPQISSPEQQLQTAKDLRQRLRERQKIVGLLVIVGLILLLALLRFGPTIPWGAR